MALQVEIVTPNATVFSGEAKEIVIPGAEGQFSVLPGHDILLSLVRPGITSLITDQGETRYVVNSGFAQAGPELVTLLAEGCWRGDEVDKPTASQDLIAAELELQNADPTTQAWRTALAARQLAQAKLEV